MNISFTRRRMVLAAMTTAIAVTPFLSPGPAGSAGTAGTAARPAHPMSIRPVITGLAAPRGIAFDGQGSMYVAESGVAGSGQAGLTQSGRVTKYRWGHTRPSWARRFSSFYEVMDPSAPPDVLGPEGLSATSSRCSTRRAAGAHAHRGARGPCGVYMVMSESTLGLAATTNGAVRAPQAGHLYRLDGRSGVARNRADVGRRMWRWTRRHRDLFPDDFPDANPYGLLVTRDARTGRTRTFVADAAANTVLEVMRHGKIRIVAYIPNEKAAPFRDATPTCIAQGPDGWLYVGTLDLLANFGSPNGNRSKVWRVNPNAHYPTKPRLWTRRLTTVTACTFDRAGNFWATEMFQGGPQAMAPGDVVRIPFSHPRTHTRIGLGRLPVPGGIAQGPDGAMYVTVGSAAPGTSGGVMRVGR